MSGAYTRTAHRRDFSLAPTGITLLDLLRQAGLPTVGIGKIDDLYAGRGLETAIHTASNADGVERIIEESSARSSGFIMANLVDFDMLYGHRNDPGGFARALAEFDALVPALLDTLGPEDVLILTADHGNDPVSPSTDHSREYVPVLWYDRRHRGTPLGTRASFADIGKTVAEIFGLVDLTVEGRAILQPRRDEEGRTLERALDHALARNPDAQLARHRIAAAQAAVPTA